MMPEWHQLVCMSGHVKESGTAKILQLYATSRSTSVSTRLDIYIICFVSFDGIDLNVGDHGASFLLVVGLHMITDKLGLYS